MSRKTKQFCQVHSNNGSHAVPFWGAGQVVFGTWFPSVTKVPKISLAVLQVQTPPPITHPKITHFQIFQPPQHPPEKNPIWFTMPHWVGAYRYPLSEVLSL